MLEEIQLQQVLPQEIEKRSFEIITEELGNVELDPLQAPIIKRAIHTSADFDYLKNLTFSELAVEQFHTAIKNGACIVTDTQMAKSGINKKELAKYGGEENCSEEYDLKMVKNLIEKLKKQNWTFTFIGTDDLDVENIAHGMGIDNHLQFSEDEAGTRAMFARENRARERYNKCRAMDCKMEAGSYFEEK